MLTVETIRKIRCGESKQEIGVKTNCWGGSKLDAYGGSKFNACWLGIFETAHY